MNIKIAIVVVVGIIAIISLIIVIVASIGIGNYPNWETPWKDVTPDEEYGAAPRELNGVWGQEILLEFEDGNTESLKPLFDSQLLSISYGGKNLKGLSYKLDGKASGTGYDNVVIDVSNYEYALEIKKGSIIKHTHTTKFSNLGYVTKNLPVDGEWHTLVTNRLIESQIAPDSLSSGSYTTSIVPSGTLKCRKNGEWITEQLPGIISFNIEIQEDQEERWIKVEFKSGVDFQEGITVIPPLKCWKCNPDGTAEYAYYPSEYHDVCPPKHPIGPQENPPECSDPTKPTSLPLTIVGYNENNDHYIHIEVYPVVANKLTVEQIGFKWAALVYDIADWDIYAVHNGKQTHIGHGIHPYWTLGETKGIIKNIYEVPVLIDPISFPEQIVDEIIIKVDSILSNMIPSWFCGTLDLTN